MHGNGGKGGRVLPSCGSARGTWWEEVGRAACELAWRVDDGEEGEQVRERRTRRTRSGGTRRQERWERERKRWRLEMAYKKMYTQLHIRYIRYNTTCQGMGMGVCSSRNSI